jgi:polysaccharide biosynthesis protein PslH
MKPEILFLSHRIPFPPNRGDKMRSWHLLRHLGRSATVHLGTFADDEADAAHLGALREAMQGSLGEAYVEPRHRDRAWPVRALIRGEPMALAAFRGKGMDDFVARILARPEVGAVLAFSIQMARFVPARADLRFVMDFVDFDSAKFAAYAEKGRLPWSLIFRREAKRLFACEREAAARADLGLFVSEDEAALFRDRAAIPGADIRALSNGIDLGFYDPAAAFATLDRPGADGGALILFTGQMNYQPNIDAVTAFAEKAMPLIRAQRPDARFAIVGRHPTPAIVQLDGRNGTIVTGEVPCVRPWLAAAAIVVAPLAIARGIQNKVLEAMAMGRPVVASTPAFTGIDAEPGRDLIVADGAAAQAEAVLALLADPDRAAALGKAGRKRMEQGYSWDARLAPLASMMGLPG